MADSPKDGQEIPRAIEGRVAARLGWRTPLAVLLFYGVVIAGATYPRVASMADSLPGLRVDPLNHIWMMKWYKSCLLQGRPYVMSPDLQHPVGFPLALNSPMLGQAALFLPLSLAFPDDYVCYNILWFLGFLTSGMAVFALTWSVLRDRFAAAFGGLLGMLCTPVMMRGHGHLELMYAGTMGLFLACWIRYVDRPRRGGLLLAASTYLFGALMAAYFAVLPTVPAVLYVAWSVVAEARREGRSAAVRWLTSRVRWFAGFVALVVPGMLLIFSSQYWATARGLSMERPLSAFAKYGAPLWTYFVPTGHHAASAVASGNWYHSSGLAEGEFASYLGIATVMLLGFAAIRRVSFPKAGFWWLALGAAIVLSMGAYANLGSHRIPLPGLWIRQTVPMFKSLRAPCRFNLLVCVIAAVIAAAGLRQLMAGVRSTWTRGLIGLAAVALAIGDLSMVPYTSDPVRPPMPGAYAWIKARNPNAAILEAPLLSSGCPHALTETCAYWQSFHGLRTTAGYSSFINIEFDDLMVDHSPFFAETLFNPTILDHPESLSIGVVSEVALRDYIWLLSKRARLDFILLHGWEESAGVRSPAFLKLAEAMSEAMVFAEPKILVYDAARLTTPARPVLLCDDGMRCWRGRPGPPSRVIGRDGNLTAYVPEGGVRHVFTLEARGYRQARVVTLKAGEAELARWEVDASDYRTFESPPITLPAGVQTLTLHSDGEDAPVNPDESASEWDSRPYGIQILKVGLKPAP